MLSYIKDSAGKSSLIPINWDLYVFILAAISIGFLLKNKKWAEFIACNLQWAFLFFLKNHSNDSTRALNIMFYEEKHAEISFRTLMVTVLAVIWLMMLILADMAVWELLVLQAAAAELWT